MANGSRDSKSASGARVAIIDYGMGNVQSVKAALARLGCQAEISSEAHVLEAAEGLVLPGVGAFGLAMENLERLGLVKVMNRCRDRGTPLLGVCLGMQLFAEESEEKGQYRGLGWIPGKVVGIDSLGGKLSVPHVGWNTITPAASPLFAKVPKGTHFYFDHSFHFDCPREFRSSVVDYGTELTASVERGNIFGVQFHPEKSQSAGLHLLRGFLNAVRERSAAC